ncbi:hypothetical protein EBZ35_07535, partial [bacterium]|nr:hypothetical protein [bacterium]
WPVIPNANPGFDLVSANGQLTISHRNIGVPVPNTIARRALTSVTLDLYGHIIGGGVTDLDTRYNRIMALDDVPQLGGSMEGNLGVSANMRVDGTMTAPTVMTNRLQATLVGNAELVTHLQAGAMTGVAQLGQGGTQRPSLPNGLILTGDGQGVAAMTLPTQGVVSVVRQDGEGGLVAGPGIGMATTGNQVRLFHPPLPQVPIKEGELLGGIILNDSGHLIGVVTSNQLTLVPNVGTVGLQGTLNVRTVSAAAFRGNGTGIRTLSAAQVVGVMPISQGGTGEDHITAQGILVGQDNGVGSLSLAPGELLMGGDTSPVGGRLMGESNSVQVLITGGQMVVGLPQNIGPTARVKWRGLTANTVRVGGVGLDPQSMAILPFSVSGTLSATVLSGSGATLTTIPLQAVSGVFSVARGGTGQSQMPAGGLVVGGESDVVSLVIPAGSLAMGSLTGVTTGQLMGQANQVAVNWMGTQYNVSPIQDVHATANIQWHSLTANQTVSIGQGIMLSPRAVTLSLAADGRSKAWEISGMVSATQWVGSGAGLSNISLAHLVGVLPVSRGGTGLATLPLGVLVGGASGQLSGLGPLQNGQLLGGGARGPVGMTLRDESGTIRVREYDNTLQLSLPQSIDRTAFPTFERVTLTDWRTPARFAQLTTQNIQLGLSARPALVTIEGSIAATRWEGKGTGLTRLTP